MARANKGYEIRSMVCDWALDIPMGDTTFVLYFNSQNNAELVKAVLEWEDAHPNEAIPYQPTLTPPNEPLYPHPDGDTSILACPCCGSGEYLHNEDGNEQNYCGQCGQAIDWSRQPEGEADAWTGR